MFSSSRTSTLGQRALGALGLVRSFLLLEDDYDVDWEVDDQEEWTEVDHPHRVALRGGAIAERLAHRRPGQLEPRPQVCLSPIERQATARARGAALRSGSMHTN